MSSKNLRIDAGSLTGSNVGARRSPREGMVAVGDFGFCPTNGTLSGSVMSGSGAFHKSSSGSG